MSEPQTAQVLAWSLPPIDGPIVGRPPRAEDLNALEREAWEHGLAAGREAGVAAVRREQQAALTEVTNNVQRLSAILDLMSHPLSELDTEVEQQLATLAGAIARQVLRRELETHPDQIVSIVRDTLAFLPVSAREVRVFLHPDDAALVRLELVNAAADPGWSVVDDPALSRGGCRVASHSSMIDARIEARLATAIAAALGDDGNARGGDV